MIYKKIIFAMLALLVVPAVISAATFAGGEEYSLGKNTNIDGNLYAGGAVVSIAGNIAGDLITGGGNVIITGNIKDDLLAGGGSMQILGKTGGDVRIGGGSITIGETIGGDLVAGGGYIHVLPDVIVGGDAVIYGGAVLFQGDAFKDLRIGAEEVTINGRTRGDTLIEANSKIIIGEGAVIDGDLVYKAPREDILEINDSAKINGEVKYEKMDVIALKDRSEGGWMTFLGLFTFIQLILALTAGIVGVLVFKRFSREVIVRSVESFWGELVRGIVVLIVVPVVVILLFATILGTLLGALGGLVYLILLILSGVYAGIVFGGVIQKYLLKKETEANWMMAVYGILILYLIGFIPFFGWIIKFVFILVTIGSFSHLAHQKIWLRR